MHEFRFWAFRGLHFVVWSLEFRVERGWKRVGRDDLFSCVVQ